MQGANREDGAREEIFDRPQHPYPRTLVQSVPRFGGASIAC
ncbi:hypothetical protein ACFVZH_36215 [Streptomyces sp. NPDC059534]